MKQCRGKGSEGNIPPTEYVPDCVVNAETCNICGEKLIFKYFTALNFRGLDTIISFRFPRFRGLTKNAKSLEF